MYDCSCSFYFIFLPPPPTPPPHTLFCFAFPPPPQPTHPPSFFGGFYYSPGWQKKKKKKKKKQCWKKLQLPSFLMLLCFKMLFMAASLSPQVISIAPLILERIISALSYWCSRSWLVIFIVSHIISCLLRLIAWEDAGCLTRKKIFPRSAIMCHF